jgi:ABC-type sugar transport system ATPase subunit
MNLLDVDLVDGEVRLGGVPVPLSDDVRAGIADAGTSFTVGVRPEHLALETETERDDRVSVPFSGSAHLFTADGARVGD